MVSLSSGNQLSLGKPLRMPKSTSLTYNGIITNEITIHSITSSCPLRRPTSARCGLQGQITLVGFRLHRRAHFGGNPNPRTRRPPPPPLAAGLEPGTFTVVRNNTTPPPKINPASPMSSRSSGVGAAQIFRSAKQHLWLGTGFC